MHMLLFGKDTEVEVARFQLTLKSEEFCKVLASLRADEEATVYISRRVSPLIGSEE